MQLVITEKPSVAESISAVIGANDKKNGYREGSGYIVSWCVGHLIEAAPPEAYKEEWKKWSYESLPIIPDKWETQVKPETAAQFKVIKELMHRDDVESVICATDAGREGELIFRLVYEKAGCNKPIKRLWISSMEESAIREGFENLRPGSEYDNLYESALCRQRADWIVGMNGTRLFTVLYGNKTLKVGRVQTPTLAMLVDREVMISTFVKEPYYMAHITTNGIDAVTEKLPDKAKAETIAASCDDATAMVISVKKELNTTQPPKLYDLTTLQRDANRIFGFTAKQTLDYTQSLYEKKLVTYPRTDSRYLSDDMEQTAAEVISAVLGTLPEMNGFIPGTGFPDIRRVMDSSKVTDHHAVIPTAEIERTDLTALPDGERKVLSLIANRLLCAAGQPYVYETVKAEILCKDTLFTATGKTVVDEGWKAFETVLKRQYKGCKMETDDAEPEDRVLPELTEGMEFFGFGTNVTEHFTQPPKHFTEDSLLAAMEKAGAEDESDDVERKGLGTPATRADVIEKLVKDGFVVREKKNLIPTEDGIKLITILPDVVKSPKLTADWENDLAHIAKGEMSPRDFMDGITAMITDLVGNYHEITDDLKSLFGRSKEVLGKCPGCSGNVVKGKFGAYCENKCGLVVGRVMGKNLSDSEVKDILAGKKVLVRGLKGKKGSYDAYLIPNGVEDFSYSRDGNEVHGTRIRFSLEFLQNKKNKHG